MQSGPMARTTMTSPGERPNAADMLPQDLWEMLTGQRRSGPTPLPQPQPTLPQPPRAPSVQQPATQVPAARSAALTPRPLGQPSREDAAITELLRNRERETEKDRRAAPAVAEIQSLETEPPSAAVRDAQFHEKLAHLAPPPSVHEAGDRLHIDLRNRSALARAILFREVLGPPKGLE